MRSSDTTLIQVQESELPVKLLQDAFHRFNDASVKLEERHMALQREVEELRAALKIKDEEIKRTERLAMLGETAAAIAHEVRNPLGAIKLFVSLLKGDLTENPSSLKIVNQIDASITSLDHVVTNILQFSSDRKINRTPINLETIIKEQVLQLQNSHHGKAILDFSASGNAFMLGDECGLRQVVYNLLINALQATHYKGQIKIACEGAPECVEVKISDNGPGVPEQILPRLFEPFVTGRNEGTGLGLAIVRRIVVQHGGSITVSNEGGAAFVIKFPREVRA